MEVVNYGLSKTPDLILTFFIGQYILYAFSKCRNKICKRYMNIRLS